MDHCFRIIISKINTFSIYKKLGNTFFISSDRGMKQLFMWIILPLQSCQLSACLWWMCGYNLNNNNNVMID